MRNDDRRCDAVSLTTTSEIYLLDEWLESKLIETTHSGRNPAFIKSLGEVKLELCEIKFQIDTELELMFVVFE